MADVTPKTSSTRPSTSGAGTIGGTEIRNPDAVQKNILDVWGWVEKNAKAIAAGVGVLFLGAIAYLVVQYMQDRKETAAQNAYYAVESQFTKIQDGFERARLRDLMPNMADPSVANEKTATGDLQKDYGQTITDLEKVARDHAGTTAGAQAALLAGDVYITYKMPDKAVELSELVTKNLGAKNVLTSLAHVQQGSALAAKGDCQAALGSWQKVMDNKSAPFLHADVGLRSGLCFETLNQPEKAAEMYRKVIAEGGSTVSAATAKNLLRALEVSSKIPVAATAK